MSETNRRDEMDDLSPMGAEIGPSVIQDVVADTWNTYLGATVVPCASDVSPTSGTNAGSDVLSASAETEEGRIEARIRVTGEAQWEVSLCGSWTSAEEATRRMLESGGQAGAGSGRNSNDPECVPDAWGELVNTIAGNLKPAFGLGPHRLSIPEAFRDPLPPVSKQGATELLFDWDGYRASVRVVRVTSA